MKYFLIIMLSLVILLPLVAGAQAFNQMMLMAHKPAAGIGGAGIFIAIGLP